MLILISFLSDTISSFFIFSVQRYNNNFGCQVDFNYSAINNFYERDERVPAGSTPKGASLRSGTVTVPRFRGLHPF
jgi:hypothetical protein